MLGVTTLTKRRQRGDLIQMYKFMHNLDEFDNSDRFQIVRNQMRGHCIKYHKEITTQQQRENLFYNRTANLWNTLPEKLVNAASMNTFKAGFDRWMSSEQK
jgi:hypothetical protein